MTTTTHRSSLAAAAAALCVWIGSSPVVGAWTTTSVNVARRRGGGGRTTRFVASATAAANNVVLRPSVVDDEFAEDSYKIGSPRVHRYADGVSDAEYVMWYHGRSTENVDPRLPPLSTGRIFRAVSRNGLAWRKCVDETSGASATEDVAGVSLGLNTDSWWCFDTAHVGLGQVLLPLSTPAIMTEGGVYLMYYMGGTHEEDALSDYVADPSLLPDDAATATLKGLRMRVGVALSQDGQSWGRVEGDDPTGAVVVPDDDELYCAWPDVVLDDESKDAPFTMYYSAMTADSKQKVVARAVSEDGFRWEKKGVCLAPDDDGGLDAAGAARATVLRRYDFDGATWNKVSKRGEPQWIMYYEGVCPRDNKHRLLRADSADGGKTWTKRGLALDVGDEGDDAWDCMGVGSPHLLRMDDGRIRLYYTGQGKGGTTAIGVATTTAVDDGIADLVFEREQAEFAMPQ